ncbi:MAG: hypothetical protein KC492_00480, partial [Myxococcales bacterium]|nr:hypothetical protein [Myxococcales bacterium]
DLLGVALVSGAAISAQIALTRVLSITLWHHFAYLVVGLALLGFGTAGAWLSVRRVSFGVGELRLALARRGRWGAAASVASVLLALLIRVNPLELFRSSSTFLALGMVIALCTVPFLAVGVVLGTALGAWSQSAGRVYAADLIGGGAFGGLAVVLIPSLGALGLLLFAGCAVSVAALLFALGSPAVRRTALLSGALVGVCLLLGRDEDSWITPAATKEISLYHRPDVGIRSVEHREWTPHGRIDVSYPFDGPPLVAGEVNTHTRLYHVRAVTQDGSAPTTIHQIKQDPAELEFLPHSSTAAVWVLRGAKFGPTSERAPGGPKVLVIGVGGGVDVMLALAHGASHVTGAEINPAILRLLKSRYLDFTGHLAERPDVDLVQSEGRTFIRASHERYDVIQLAGVDTFTALASGAYSLAEAYVYTAQAFDDYLSHLTETGCLSVSRLILSPPRETLRLTVTANEALERQGVKDPWRHIAVLRTKQWATLMVCKQAISKEQRDRLVDFAKREKFALAFDPGAPAGPFAQAVVPDLKRRADFFRTYPYRLAPATDEAPFFFDYFKWTSLFALPQMKSESLYGTNVPIGHGVLLGTLLVTLLLAFIGIRRPLRLLQLPEQLSRRRAGVYFACLGVGYLLVEVALIQRLSFLLGHPTYGLSIVLSGLLAASGVGALVSQRLTSARWLRFAVPLVVVAVGALSWRLLPSLVGQSFGVRVAVSLGAIVPLGFLLGMPFPRGIKLLGARSVQLVPWAFGVNAFFTVLASAVAPLFALVLGFSTLFVLAALSYMAAFWAFGRGDFVRSQKNSGALNPERPSELIGSESSAALAPAPEDTAEQT